MSWFPSSEYADWWYDLSWKGIIGFGIVAAFATAATVVFTVLQFWSDGVRDARAEVRTLALERETSAANADAARANATAAAANERAARLEKEAADAKLEYERLRESVAWRQISRSNQQKIADAIRLAGLRPDMYVTSNDPESGNFRRYVGDILLMAGDPTPRFTTSISPGPMFVGVGVQGPDETTRNALVRAFADGGIDARDEGEFERPRIKIGIKPPPR